MQYLILQHPGHNRVYYNVAGKMAEAELALALPALSVSARASGIHDVAGVRYLGFETEGALSAGDWTLLSRLSFVFAFFHWKKEGEQDILLPIRKTAYEYVDNKISSLLKYQGKTNELFTKMMVNVALLSSDFSGQENLQLLDPVAGKGTTLFEALVYGMHAYGIELAEKSVHETAVFFKKYLETERFKHVADKRQVAGTNRHSAVMMHEFTFASDKEAFKQEALQKKLGILVGNTTLADTYFKANRFHFLVGDLPYGIFHGNAAEKKSAGVSRNPSDLLRECLPAWHKVLKKDGIVVIAWNSFLVSRFQLAKVFAENNFEVFHEPPYDKLEHMVDQSIKRDILVARRV